MKNYNILYGEEKLKLAKNPNLKSKPFNPSTVNDKNWKLTTLYKSPQFHFSQLYILSDYRDWNSFFLLFFGSINLF